MTRLHAAVLMTALCLTITGCGETVEPRGTGVWKVDIDETLAGVEAMIDARLDEGAMISEARAESMLETVRQRLVAGDLTAHLDANGRARFIVNEWGARLESRSSWRLSGDRIVLQSAETDFIPRSVRLDGERMIITDEEYDGFQFVLRRP